MSKKLKKIEKETHVHFNEYNLTATITTYNPKWINRFKKYGIEPVEVDETGMHVFEGIPAHWMIPRKPPARSEKQKEASRANIRKLLERNAATSGSADADADDSDNVDVNFDDDAY